MDWSMVGLNAAAAADSVNTRLWITLNPVSGGDDVILKQRHDRSPAGFTGFQLVLKWTQQTESAPDRQGLTAATNSHFQLNSFYLPVNQFIINVLQVNNLINCLFKLNIKFTAQKNLCK